MDSMIQFILEVGTYAFFGLIFLFLILGSSELLIISVVLCVMFAVSYMSYTLVKLKHELRDREEEMEQIYEKFLKWLKDVEGKEENG